MSISQHISFVFRNMPVEYFLTEAFFLLRRFSLAIQSPSRGEICRLFTIVWTLSRRSWFGCIEDICKPYNYSSFACISFSLDMNNVWWRALERSLKLIIFRFTLLFIHTFSSFVYCLLFLSFLGCPRKKPSRTRARERNIAN